MKDQKKETRSFTFYITIGIFAESEPFSFFTNKETKQQTTHPRLFSMWK